MGYMKTTFGNDTMGNNIGNNMGNNMGFFFPSLVYLAGKHLEADGNNEL